MLARKPPSVQQGLTLTGDSTGPPGKRIGPDPHPGRRQPPQTTTASLAPRRLGRRCWRCGELFTRSTAETLARCTALAHGDVA